MGIGIKGILVVATLVFSATNANAWYCSAESKNGASGWGFHFFKDESEKIALSDCKSHSKGKMCHITYCW